MTGKEKLFNEQFFHLSTIGYQTRDHSLKIAKQCTRLDLRKHFFSQRLVNEWNSLPQHVIEASTVNMFKNRLDKYWRDMSNKSDAYEAHHSTKIQRQRKIYQLTYCLSLIVVFSV